MKWISMEDRDCRNCAWGVMMGDDEYCIQKDVGAPRGLKCVQEGEVWCCVWRYWNDPHTKARRNAWFKGGAAQKCRDRHTESLVGPLDKLHLEG